MKKAVERYKEGDKTELSRYYKASFEMRYDAILTMAKAVIIPSGARKKSKAENLLTRFVRYKSEITRFTKDFDVPFDNNQAERDVRNIKVKEKVSAGFRSGSGAVDYADTASVLGTAPKFGRSVADTVLLLFNGTWQQFNTTTE